MNSVISWNLPAQLVYAPGTALSLVVIVTNPDDVPRQYSLKIRLWQNGYLVGEEVITIDGAAYFQLGGNESAVFYDGMSLPITDAVLELVVVDDAGEYVDSIACALVSMTVPATTQVVHSLPALIGLAAVAEIIEAEAVFWT